MPDDVNLSPEIKALIEKDIKGLGGDVKKLSESMQKDLADVRKVVDETKGAIGAEVKSQVAAMTESVLKKHDALESGYKAEVKKAEARIDELEKKLNRPGAGGGNGLSPKEVKAAVDFLNAGLALRGQLNHATVVTEHNLDVEQVKSYRKVFNLSLRRDRGLLSAEEAKSLTVGDDANAGLLATPEISSRVLEIQYESSPLREIATVDTTAAGEIEYPVDIDEASAGWAGEVSSRTTTNTPAVGQNKIVAHEMYAAPKASQKFLEDAGIDVEAWLGRKIGQKFGRLEATAFVSGDGVNKPRGFLTYAAGTAWGQIQQVASGLAADFDFDSLIRLMTELKDYYAAGAVWMMKRATVGQIMLKKDGTGQYLWHPRLDAGRPATLLGHEVKQAADMQAVGADALPIAFGNFREGYTIVDRLGIQTLRDPYTAKPWVVVYARKRVGGAVTNFEAIKLLKCSAS